MSELLQAGALLCTGFGLVAGTAVLVRTTQIRAALAVLLEFLLAAGLLRLADDPAWPQILAATAVIAVRRLLSASLRG